MDHSFCFISVLLFQTTLCFKKAEVTVFVLEGQDCELPCSGHKGVRVSVLHWTELDQGRDLLLLRAGNVQDGYEDPNFTNRVQLLDPQLTSGDLTVVLKKVTLEESGIYECLALYENGPEISQCIHLNVTGPDTTTPKRGTEPTEGLGTGLVITVIVVMIGVGLLIILCLKRSQCLRYLSCESCLEKSLHPSSGSNTSSSTTSSNLSNGSCKKHLFINDPPSLSPPSESCHLTVVEGFACSNPETQTGLWSQDLSLTRSSSHVSVL